MKQAKNTSSRGRRFRRRNFELPGDPFAQTKQDYAFNLVSAGVLRQARDDMRAMELVVQLVDGRGKLRKKTTGEKLVPLEMGIAAFGRLAHDAVRAEGVNLRVPSPPGAPVARNIRLLARTLALPALDTEILQLALACRESDMRALFDPIPCQSRRELAAAVGAAIARPAADVAAALGAGGRLAAMGLLTVEDNNGDVDDWLEIDARLLAVLPLPGLAVAGLLERFVPRAAPTTLERGDYAHLAGEVALAGRVLAGAVRAAKHGVNVLLHGPTGTGKTELARLLAADVGVPLYVAGREDEQGGSPTAAERLTSLKLGNRIVRAGQGLLLFDEMEDLFDGKAFAPFASRPGHRRDDARMSKQWFNMLLEKNPIPTIWVSNDVSGVDPAYLRRFSYAVEVGPLTATGRRRTWDKHLGSGHGLPANDVELLARRFEVSPAQIGGAVATARLAAAGPLDRALLEDVLRPQERVLARPAAPVIELDPGSYRAEVVNTPVDLEDVARRLELWRPGNGVGLSLCLYGPPGTGKSAYVHHLARRMDRPLVVKRASDVVSCWIGESEKAIAAAFDRARREEAVLLFDEADSFLRDRRGAVRAWEVTETNEFLQQLEAFAGVVACTTNLLQTIDQAALRRFTFKIPFLFMRAEQAVALLRATLAGLGVADTAEAEAEAEAEEMIARVANLTPGDFAAAARRVRALGAPVTAVGFAAEVVAEVRVKEGVAARIGF